MTRVEKFTGIIEGSLSTIRRNWAILAAIILLGVMLLWLAPAEQTLGQGIKVVYVHVALIWTGMTGILLAVLMGFALLAGGQVSLQRWTHTVGWVSLGFFLAGLGTSVLAAIVNWGGVFWQEPRYEAMLRVVAIALIVQIVTGWPISERLKGALYALPGAFLIGSVLLTPLVLHPQNPAQTSPSLAIRGSFFGLFVLTALAAAWLVIYFQPDETKPGQ